jgi:hypothetical protein
MRRYSNYFAKWSSTTPSADPLLASTLRGLHACQRTSGGSIGDHRRGRLRSTTRPRGQIHLFPNGVSLRGSRATEHRVSQEVSPLAAAAPRGNSGRLRWWPSPDIPGRCCSSAWCPVFYPASRRSGKYRVFWPPPLSRAFECWRLRASAFRARRAPWLSNSWD